MIEISFVKLEKNEDGGKMQNITLTIKKAICAIYPKASPKLRKKIKLYRKFIQSEGVYQEFPNEIGFLRSYMSGLVRPWTVPMIPYEWTKEYTMDDKMEDLVKLCKNGCWYVTYKEKQLYFPKVFSKNRVIAAYKQLLMEQDERSPHKYFSNRYNEGDFDVFVDVGCAEAIIALDIVENHAVKKIILLEGEDFWNGALKSTFEPYKDKVVIINKYAGERDTHNIVSLDTALSEEMAENKRIGIKIDVEGSELSVLGGASRLLSYVRATWFVATYHLYGDYDAIKDVFKKYNYDCEESSGFMLRYSQNYERYFFTKGIIRAKRN